jgi:hypothetical protein
MIEKQILKDCVFALLFLEMLMNHSSVMM